MGHVGRLSVRYPDLYSTDVGHKLQSVVDAMVDTRDEKDRLLRLLAHCRPTKATRRTLVELTALLDALVTLQLPLVDQL